jgi:transcriptional regulator with PAS, ATPase and Fis domain
LQGETGTGKTLVATWIKDQVGKEVPFEPVSTANLSKELIDIELFGTLTGAWTGAVDRPGRLLAARGGIVFLDELGAMGLDVQAKLLYYLDNFLVRPQGWPLQQELYSPALVVAATNMDLEELSRRGAFRYDLYRRFKFKLEIPPLRERKSDFRLLVDFVLQDPSINRGSGDHREVNGISVSALKKLEAYVFPGNFRQLEDCMATAIFNAVQHGRDTILKEDIEF